MRHAVAVLYAAALTANCTHAEGYGPSLTVLLDFEDTASSQSIGEMRREVQQIMKPAGIFVNVRLRSDLQPAEHFEDLVLIRFKGLCRGMPDPMLIDERGPAAFARFYTVQGQVQPFGEVACDRVRRAVDSALWGGQRRDREELFGRALGRVLAHELVHVLGKTPAHGKSGVFRESLSGAQLVSDRLELHPADRDRLRHILRVR
jgi:hypothetical protein